MAANVAYALARSDLAEAIRPSLTASSTAGARIDSGISSKMP